MAIHIKIDPEYRTMLDQTCLRQAIRITLKSTDYADADITLKITGDEEMQNFNLTYRNINQTTDVLSFNQDYIDPETGRLYLGDIIISFDQVKVQAEEIKQTVDQECARLAIHGTLHLLGYDHAEPKEKEVMWEQQETLLSKVMESFHGGQ